MDGSAGDIGAFRWQFELPDSLTYYRYSRSMYTPRARNFLVSPIPAVADDKVFFVTGQNLCALDAHTGRYMYAAPGPRTWGHEQNGPPPRPAHSALCMTE